MFRNKDRLELLIKGLRERFLSIALFVEYAYRECIKIVVLM